jgi:hypothetical protein
MREMKDQMKQWAQANNVPLPAARKRKKKKQKPSKPRDKEKLSRHDLHELMGVNRACYYKRRGVIRQK